MATAVIDTPTYLASPGLSVTPEIVSGGGISTETPCVGVATAERLASRDDGSRVALGGLARVTSFFSDNRTLHAVPCQRGAEQVLARRISRAMAPSCAMAACPMRVSLRSGGGVLVADERPLVPGVALVSVASNVPQAFLGRALASAAGRAVAPVPLSPAQAALLRGLCVEGLSVPVSAGVIERGCLCVSSGPLRGMEPLVRRIDRHKRLAWVDFALEGAAALGLSSTDGQIAVGLEVVAKN